MKTYLNQQTKMNWRYAMRYLYLVVQDQRHDHSMLIWMIGLLLIGLFEQLHMDLLQVILDPIHQPIFSIHNHPIHHSYMFHKSNPNFTSIFQTNDYLSFELNEIDKVLVLCYNHMNVTNLY